MITRKFTVNELCQVLGTGAAAVSIALPAYRYILSHQNRKLWYLVAEGPLELEYIEEHATFLEATAALDAKLDTITPEWS